MDYSICSREFERDYTWDNSHASESVAKYAEDSFAAFEGSLAASRIAALLRRPGHTQGVMLYVSVSTSRIDFRDRPIRTTAVFLSTNQAEEKLLAAFFAECLNSRDEETLYAPQSKVAKSIESLYQTKKPDNFLKFCRALPECTEGCLAPKGRMAIPRNDIGERKTLANALSAIITDEAPFLLVLTDRLPTDVLRTLGSIIDRGTAVRIFSNATTETGPIQEPQTDKEKGFIQKKHVSAAAWGGIAILIAAAIIIIIRGCCSESTEQLPTNTPTSDPNIERSEK
ncbi:MAG: hypothetical protein IKF72_10015 [Kiritimatiellae bacterium]|nr:hypothetical protein [Kiritimatiellia bacterium]